MSNIEFELCEARQRVADLRAELAVKSRLANELFCAASFLAGELRAYLPNKEWHRELDVKGALAKLDEALANCKRVAKKTIQAKLF